MLVEADRMLPGVARNFMPWIRADDRKEVNAWFDPITRSPCYQRPPGTSRVDVSPVSGKNPTLTRH